jgi:Zn-dependent peptidase ImmA (M78 family)/DNA-binding XRE family transcriptional regulator
MPDEVFAGSRLQVAREFRGLTQKELGQKVVASPTLISLCEADKKETPAHDLIQACAEILGFKRDFFYRPIEEIFRNQECSFRHRRSAPERLKTQIRAHATLLGMVVGKLRAFFKFPELDIPMIRAATKEEIEIAAERSRKHWRLDPNAPIHQVGRVLERAGVIIVPHVVQSTKVDAFSRNGRISVIFMNQAIPSTSRWVFDIAHECGHLVMHSGIVTGTPETEAAADRFGSAFLMPRKAFSREFPGEAFSWEHIFQLKKRWRVSAAAIVRRAYDLGLLGAVGYRQAYKYMSWKSWNTEGEPFEPEFQQPELLTAALAALGKNVDLTIAGLCSELHFTPETFEEITGVSVPLPENRPILLATK